MQTRAEANRKDSHMPVATIYAVSAGKDSFLLSLHDNSSKKLTAVIWTNFRVRRSRHDETICKTQEKFRAALPYRYGYCPADSGDIIVIQNHTYR